MNKILNNYYSHVSDIASDIPNIFLPRMTLASQTIILL